VSEKKLSKFRENEKEILAMEKELSSLKKTYSKEVDERLIKTLEKEFITVTEKINKLYSKHPGTSKAISTKAAPG